jgi:hypothetical protein
MASSPTPPPTPAHPVTSPVSPAKPHLLPVSRAVQVIIVSSMAHHACLCLGSTKTMWQ